MKGSGYGKILVTVLVCMEQLKKKIMKTSVR
jgi:hypothetical protein